MEPETTSILKEINAKLDSIQRSTAVLADIFDRNIGIERVWQTRGIWEGDPNDGLAVWRKRVCQAEGRVDIVSNTFWNNWFKDENFQEAFFASLVRGNTARLLIYDPYADVLDRRAIHERGPKGEMRGEIKSTLEAIARHRETGDAAVKKKIRKNLQVRLTDSFYHLAHIIHADDYLLVAIYLSGKAGTPSPTFQVRGSGTEFFKTYSEQIEILWKEGRKVSDDEFHQIAFPPQEPSSRVKLHQLLTTHFGEGELRDLCFYLDVDYENLAGEGKGGKARELILYFEKRKQLSDLVERCRQLRPNVPW